MRATNLTHGIPVAGLMATVLLISFGCAGKLPTQTPLMVEAGGVELTTSELHDLTYEYSKIFAAKVEYASDRIRTTATDEDVRYNALLWKTYSIPAMQRAALQRDPFGGLIDLRVFNLQMRNYFTDGSGRDLFGEQQSIALETCDELDTILMTVVRWTQPERDSTRQDSLLNAFADASPIDNPLFVRTSTRPLYFEMTAMDIKGGMGGVAQMNQSVAAINDRLEVYTETLPKQIRWQMEMIIEDYIRKEHVPRLLSSAASIDSSIIEINGFFVGIEDLIAREKAALVEIMNQSLDEASTVVENERATILTDVDRQTQLIISDVSALSDERIEQATSNVNDLVDRVFTRLTFLLAGLVVSILIVGVILIVLARLLRRPASPAEA